MGPLALVWGWYLGLACKIVSLGRSILDSHVVDYVWEGAANFPNWVLGNEMEASYLLKLAGLPDCMGATCEEDLSWEEEFNSSNPCLGLGEILPRMSQNCEED